MDDFDDLLRRGVDGYEPDPDSGREGLHRRVRRRQTARRVGAAAVSLTMFSVTLGAAAFVLVNRQVSPIPVAAPSPTPSPGSSIVLGKGRTWCSPVPRSWLNGEKEHERCITQTGDIVVIASGDRGGSSWSMRAFDGVYTGPDPEGFRGGGEVETTQISMICSLWTWNERVTGICVTGLGNDGAFDAGFATEFDPKGADEAAPPIEAIVWHRPPLKDVEHGGFTGHDAGQETALWFWTPAETSRIEVAIEGEPSRNALLFGPFEGLSTDLKWAVVFLPAFDTPTTVQYTAYAADGHALWTEKDHWGEENRIFEHRRRGEEVRPVRPGPGGEADGTGG